MTHFTKHALEKFGILRKHGVIVSQSSVLKAVNEPDVIDFSRLPLKVAQRNFDKNHVLRVVYKEEGNNKIIITFYPGRKKQYATKK